MDVKQIFEKKISDFQHRKFDHELFKMQRLKIHILKNKKKLAEKETSKMKKSFFALYFVIL
jgi:hypothetical protein